MVVSQK
jgi:hypothetical protein